ncbi:hypothetical protein [Nonomuraea cavernae]|uniref:hypothetical protein n=1 Tax=Nonomuraea cavernae TaxID=2045107 RepID=UPI0016671D49|nr:hypothetical protein [Nonomuraea cavernae]MCA2185689.1 hypothetical protein [Nonomuraea cavernae]
MAALVMCVLSFLSLWLPHLFEGDGAAGCAGYDSLPFGLAELWSDLHWTWLRLREPVLEHMLVLNGLPSVSVSLSTLVAAWARRPLSTVVGLFTILVVVVIALDWVFIAFSYFTLLGCAGWEGGIPWLLWRLLPVVGYGSAIVLLVVGILTHRRTR